IRWKADSCNGNKDRVFSNEGLNSSQTDEQISNMASHYGIVVNTSRKNGFVVVADNDIYHFYKE
ncbi:MAG: hypothetical protein ACOC2W_04850, partial [bacterium]